MFRPDNRAEMLPLRRENPQAARSRDVKIADFVDLHSVARVFAGRLRHVEKEFSVLESAIRLHFITHHDLSVVLPVINVEEFFVGRETEAVRAVQILGREYDLSRLLHRENAAERQFLARIFEKLWQSKRRIGEIQRAVAAVNQIIRTVQASAFKFVRKYGELPVALKPHHSTISMLVYR